MNSASKVVRSKAFEKIRYSFEKYKVSLTYADPEFASAEFLRRNPIVLMNDMAKTVPEGEEYDKFVEGFAQLSFHASITPIYDINKYWWKPVGKYLLTEVMGECDTEWKKEAIKIWMDADYTKATLD